MNKCHNKICYSIGIRDTVPIKYIRNNISAYYSFNVTIYVIIIAEAQVNTDNKAIKLVSIVRLLRKKILAYLWVVGNFVPKMSINFLFMLMNVAQLKEHLYKMIFSDLQQK